MGQKVNPFVFFDEFFHNGKVGFGFLDESGKSTDGGTPFQGVNVVLDGQHGGGVDGGSLEDGGIDLALLDHAKNLGKRTVFRSVGFETLDGSGTQDEHTVGSFSSQNLLPRVGGDIKLFPRHVHGKAGRGSIAHGDTGSVVRNEITSSRNTNSRGGSVEGEANVVVRVGLRHIGKGSVVGSVFVDLDRVSEVEVGNGITEPSLSEGFPVEDIDVLGSQHVPHGHFVGSGIGGGDNSDEVVLRDAQDALCLVNGVSETFLSDLGSVRASGSTGIQGGDIVSRSLFARTRREFGVGWLSIEILLLIVSFPIVSLALQPIKLDR